MAFVLAATLTLGLRNSAVVFLKPHAATDACETFVRGQLDAAGIAVVGAGVKTAAQIEDGKLIDQHYGSLARIAMETQPADMALSDTALETFASTFDVPWATALESALRNDEAMAKLNVDGLALEPMWRGGVQCKLAPGTYVSRLDGPSEAIYTLNGFYPAMRHSYVTDGAEVRYLVCEWDESTLSWQTFRREVIGATSPSDAAPGSMRAEILARWEALGLTSEPTLAANGVHASAGPLEGLKERCVWADASLASDALATALVEEAGMDLATVEMWLDENPVVTLGEQTDKVFDLTEELGTQAVVDLCRQQATSMYEYAPAQAIF